MRKARARAAHRRGLGDGPRSGWNSQRHVASTGGRILAEVVETESGKQSTRPQLARRRPVRRGRHADRHSVHAARLRGHGRGGGDCDQHAHENRLAAAKARGAKLGNPRLLAGSPGQARMVVTRDFSAHAIVYIIGTTYISTSRGRSSVQLNLEHQVSDVLDTIRRRREADTGGHGAAATGVSDHPSIMHGWRRGRPPLYVPAHLPARGYGLTLVERGSIGRK
jgi:hypothetical protein